MMTNYISINEESVLIICRSRSLRTPPNMFIISMAISDMGFSAINGFPLMTISAFMKKWYFGALGKSILRILDIHGTKTHKNQTPLARLAQ